MSTAPIVGNRRTAKILNRFNSASSMTPTPEQPDILHRRQRRRRLDCWPSSAAQLICVNRPRDRRSLEAGQIECRAQVYKGRIPFDEEYKS
jgi:hypothetical protein